MTKNKTDIRLSKRSIKVNEPKFEDLSAETKAMEDAIIRIEKIIKLKQSTEFQEIIRDSYKRLRYIERERMGLDVNDIEKNSICKGQWIERFKLTKELFDAENELNKTRTGLSNLRQKMDNLFSKKRKE